MFKEIILSSMFIMSAFDAKIEQERFVTGAVSIDIDSLPYEDSLKLEDFEGRLEASIPLFCQEYFEGYYVNEQALPLVLSPKDDSLSYDQIKSWAEDHQEELRDLISKQGALLLRGSYVGCAEEFAAVVKAVIGKPLIDYRGEGARSRIAEGVYTSTEAPAKFKIPLHHELSCTNSPVDYICFYCEIAPSRGTGQTLLARTEDVTKGIMERAYIWNLFEGRTLKYVSRHPPEGSFFHQINPSHKPWQQVFDTDDSEEVAKICLEKEYDFKWIGEWIELTRYVPALGGPDQYFDHLYWFNQAHLYHLNPRLCGGIMNFLMATLLYISPSTRPYEIAFEDGTLIPQNVVYEIYDVLDENTIHFSWEKGDVLLLDNRRTLHGKAPCIGERRILTTMIQ